MVVWGKSKDHKSLSIDGHIAPEKQILKSSYYKYKYYIITNSHVLEPGKNSKIKVYNPYFH
ncbi:MAG: hypothetical protein Q8755_02775, partial [Candidatus Phytoplasma australasiaticum]|nr:hypothetical protein [Candidatus Phytoplasma australasiaticum]